MNILTEEELIITILTLHSYRNLKHRNIYEEAMSNGLVYVALKKNGEYYFAPSQFVVNKDKSATTQIRNRDTGEISDEEEIDAIRNFFLRDEREDNLLDGEFLAYCEKNGVTPANKIRRYFPLIVSDHFTERNELATVSSIEEIIENILSFNSGLDSQYTDFYRGLIYNSSSNIALKVGGGYYFAPSQYAGYTDFTRNDLIMWGHTYNEAEQTISNILDQSFQDNSFLNQKLNEYLRSKIKGLKKEFSYSYCYIELKDEQELEDVLSSIYEEQETEKKRVVTTRLGQSRYKSALVSMWGQCSVTGCKNIDILRGSHAKPWKDSDNKERLDPFNGLLLIPNLDELFDRGYISFNENGEIMISECLDDNDINILGLSYEMKVDLDLRHQPYLEYHRTWKYKRL